MALTATLLQMARFGVVGLFNTALGLAAMFGGMFFFQLSAEFANLLGYIAGLTLGFWLNKRWTFSSQRKIGDAAPRYALVVVFAYLINLAVVSLTARNGVNPYVAQICGVAPYTTLCFLGFRFYVFSAPAQETMDGAIAERIRAASVFLVCVGGTILFTLAYVSAEHPAYVWDYNNYWTLYQHLGEAFKESWTNGFNTLRLSVAGDDYNESAVVPLLPVYWLAGSGRAWYIAALASIYLVPAAVIASRLAHREQQDPSRTNALALFAALSFTPFWAPTLRGYVDIAGLIPLGLAALMLRKTDALVHARARSAIAFGLLLWGAFLFRRWYAFSIVALCLTAICVVVMQNRFRRLPVKQLFGQTFSNYRLAGLSALVVALAFQPILMKRIFLTSYSDAYAAYQVDLATQLSLYYDHFGFWVLGLVLIGLIVDIARKRIDSLLCACVATLTILLFAQIQRPYVHHILPVAFFLFPAYVAALSFLTKILGSPRFTALALCGVMILNFASSFAPIGWGAAEPIRMAFPRERHAPLHLAQYDEYRRLIGDLKALEINAKIVVFASSYTFSDSLLMVLDPAMAPRIELAAQADSRDGFLWRALSADYALIGIPTPLHLNPGSQRVIEFPAKDIGAGTGIGAAYMNTGRVYALDDGVTGHLYKRVRPFSADELRGFANEFRKVYPQWPDEWAQMGFGLVSAVVALGDSAGRFRQSDPTSIFLQPGETQPTSITFRLDDAFRPRRFKASALGPDLKPCAVGEHLTFSFASDEAAPTSRVITGEETATLPAPTSGQLKISVTPNPDSRCRVGFVRFEFGDMGK